MSRTRLLALGALLCLTLGLALRARWPSAADPLPCPPELVRWSAAGVASCGGPMGLFPPPPGPALTLGLKFDLNRATARDLRLLPGLGRRLAEEVVRAREQLGRFQSWEEVDAVPGVGPAKLELLRKATEIR